MGDPNPLEEANRTRGKQIKDYIVDKNRVELLNDIRNYKKLNYEELS